MEQVMEHGNFDELAARIEGLGWLVTGLIARLEMDGQLDGPLFSADMRRAARNRGKRGPYLARSMAIAAQWLDLLEQARAHRSEGNR